MTDWQQTVPDFFPSRFFISYSSFNTDLASGIERILRAAGHGVWRDRTSLKVGDNWRTEVEFGITNSDEVIVLLTPESSASEPVAHEIRYAIRNGKRANLFATFDPKSVPGTFALVSDINYVNVAPDDLTAEVVARQVLGSAAAPHPVGIREFEWLASRRVFPRFGDLLSQGRMNRELASRYFDYRGPFEQQAGRANAMLWLNLALCGAALGEQVQAIRLAEKAVSLSSHPAVSYFLACLLQQRTRPRHLPPALLERCLQIAKAAFETRRSPLLALHLCALLADGQRSAGPVLTTLCSDALGAIGDVERDKSEVLRLLFLAPISEEMTMPLPTDLILRRLKAAVGG
jgi:hypothetical protein